MINIKTALGLVAVFSLALAGAASAADTKTYTASGNLIRISDSMLLLRTTAQDLELTRDAKTKINGQLTKGVAATVMYTKVSGQPYATEVTIGSAHGQAPKSPADAQKKK